MRRLLCLLALITLSLSPSALAQSAFDTRASHAAILDYETGDILFSKNGDIAMPPASMSKLMTALMVFEALEDGRFTLDTSLPVSENAWRRGGAASGSSTMFLEVNSRAEVGDLIRGIIVQSGNDACIVVAEALGGTEENFAQMMTERAHELGLGEVLRSGCGRAAAWLRHRGAPASGYTWRKKVHISAPASSSSAAGRAPPPSLLASHHMIWRTASPFCAAAM